MDKFNRLEEFVEAEMLNQAIDQCDQWVQGQKPLEGWQVDPMMAAQPQLMSALPELKELDKLSFSRADILALQEAVLMRDVSAWARGEQVDELEAGENRGADGPGGQANIRQLPSKNRPSTGQYDWTLVVQSEAYGDMCAQSGWFIAAGRNSTRAEEERIR